MTDYAVTLLCTMAKAPGCLYSAQQLTELSKIGLPAVSQILKKLCQNQVIESVRGAKGGYRLSLAPNQVNLANIIQVMEGPMSMTECGVGACGCDLEADCQFKNSWGQINGVIKQLLGHISLIEMNKASVNPGVMAQLFMNKSTENNQERVVTYE